jgi:hypothetical protein
MSDSAAFFVFPPLSCPSRFVLRVAPRPGTAPGRGLEPANDGKSVAQRHEDSGSAGVGSDVSVEVVKCVSNVLWGGGEGGG